MTEAAAMLRAERVSRSFGGRSGPLARLLRRTRPPLHAVRQVDLELRRGETLALVGESGCGKSTLARLLVGLDRPDGGAVRHDHGPAAAGQVQYLFQDPVAALNPRKTVAQSLQAPLRRLLRLPAPERRRRAAALLAAVGLDTGMLQRYPHELSGGQAQRVGIARALAAEPAVLVLDEPVSALDMSVQAQVLDLLRRLKTEQGLTYLFISHDLAVVEEVADRVAVMYAGRIVETGDAARVLTRPRHPYTALLLRAAPRLGAEAVAESAAADEPPDPFALPPGCAFAPRCPRATDRCRAGDPPLSGSPPAACWHPLEQGVGGAEP